MRKLLFLALLCCSVTSMAIIHFGYTYDSVKLNHAVLVRSLLKCYGADSVLRWREKRTNIQINTDTTGSVTRVTIYGGPFSPEHRNQLANELANYFKRNRVLFTAVFEGGYSTYLAHCHFKFDSKTNRDKYKFIDHNTAWHMILLKYTIEDLDQRELLDRYSDDNWYKPQLRCMDTFYVSPYDLDTSMLELSMLYVIGEYELYQLLKKGDLSVSLTTDSRGLPVEVRFRSISDKQLEQLIKERLIHFWETQNFRFDVNGDSDSHTLEMTLTIPPLKKRSPKEIDEAVEAGWKSYYDLGW